VGVAVVPVSAEVRALLILLAWVVLTGGLHLDGLADSCDGLLATTTPEKRLDIMKDPRAGSWAVVGVVLLLLGKLLLRESAPVALLIAPVAGRWMLTAAAWGYPYARSTGLGAWFKDGLGRPQIGRSGSPSDGTGDAAGGWGAGCSGLVGPACAAGASIDPGAADRVGAVDGRAIGRWFDRRLLWRIV